MTKEKIAHKRALSSKMLYWEGQKRKAEKLISQYTKEIERLEEHND